MADFNASVAAERLSLGRSRAARLLPELELTCERVLTRTGVAEEGWAVMAVSKIAGLVVSFLFASSGAFAQQPGNRNASGPQAPAERSIVRTYAVGGVLASRETETRSDSGGRQVVTSTIETPDADGIWRRTSETVTEVSRNAPANEQTVHSLYGFGMPGPRYLVETVRSERENFPDGSTRTVQDTYTPDLNGRLGLTMRQVHDTTPLSSNARQIDTVVFKPGINEALRESERIQETEQQVTPDLFRTESTRFVRDINGRLQPTDKRQFEARRVAASQFEEEETIFALDINGRLTVAERTATRRSEGNAQARIESETYSSNVPGMTRAENRLALSHRVRRTTLADGAGGSQTIEELEERVPGSPSDPLRVSQRFVDTVRQVRPDRWQTEQLLYMRDANGRMTLVVAEAGETSGR